MRTETVDVCCVCLGNNLEVVDAENALNACLDCGFVFDSPRPTVGELVAFYSRPAKYDDWIDEERIRDRLWRRRVAKMRRRSRPGSLLDVGTGIGQFLHHAQPFFDEVTGSEVSRSAVEVAESRYGLKIIEGQIEDIDITKRFDNITMFHVLEHVPDPSSTIARCVELLAPEGVLFIAVPNELDAARQRVKVVLAQAGVQRYARTGKLLLPRIVLDGTRAEIHLSHFTASSLRVLLERHGLVVIENGVDPYSIAQGWRGVMDKILRFTGGVLVRVSGRNMYDAIWMAARKVG
jgi:SAM-dependent methyltransferase